MKHIEKALASREECYLVFSIKNRLRYYRDNWQKNQLERIMMDLGEAPNDIISKKLKHVSDKNIVEFIGMAEMSLITYVLALKYEGNIKTERTERDCSIYVGDKFVANMSYLAVYIHFIEVQGDILHIEGNVSQPAVFRGRLSFGVKNNGKLAVCQFQDMKLDLKARDDIYEIRTAFSVNIPISDGTNHIEFYNILDSHECICGKINSMRFAPVADVIEGQYFEKNGKLLYIEKNQLICRNAEVQEIKNKEMQYQNNLRSNYAEDGSWAVSLRKEYWERKHKKRKPIWVFMDRPDRADDNAEALYKYVKNCPDVDSYFVLDKESKDRERLEKIGNVIDVYSREHYLLVLLADCIISSQSNGIVENPFWEKAEFFRDLYHQAKIVFLQHGVIKDDMSSTLSRYNTNFTGFVTSSVDEYHSILEYPYFYEKEQVWLTGLPRFDYLYSNPQKYILVMPSWRKGLMEQEWNSQTNNMEWVVKEDFLQSAYAKKYRSLLCNKKLKEICKEYGYKIAFMPHALIEPYIELFIDDEECIYWDSKKSYREAFAEGNILVTDFSSVAFDFAYLQKPIIYYQFDKEEFFREHTYCQGYFDYEQNGFGEVVYDEDELVQSLIEYVKSNCELKEKYRERMENTFKYHDKKNCERVFERIINCE